VVDEKNALQYKINELEERLGLLTQEIERLNSLLYEKQQANDRLTVQCETLKKDCSMWK